MTVQGQSCRGPGLGVWITALGQLVRHVVVVLLAERYWVTYGQSIPDNGAWGDLPLDHGSEELPDGLEELDLDKYYGRVLKCQGPPSLRATMLHSHQQVIQLGAVTVNMLHPVLAGVVPHLVICVWTEFMLQIGCLFSGTKQQPGRIHFGVGACDVAEVHCVVGSP